jgi:hypothetical protein
VTAHEPGSVYDIGMAGKDGSQQQGIFFGVVFQVSVLDEEVIAGGGGYAGMDGCAFALVYGMPDILDWSKGIVLDILADHEVGVVPGAVVDDDDLLFYRIGEFDIEDLIQDDGDGRSLIIAGYYDR